MFTYFRARYFALEQRFDSFDIKLVSMVTLNLDSFYFRMFFFLHAYCIMPLYYDFVRTIRSTVSHALDFGVRLTMTS